MYYMNRRNDKKNHMSITMDVEKTFDKNQHSFILKIFNKLEWEWEGQMAFIWILWENSKYSCGSERLELAQKVKDNVGHHNEFRVSFVGERVPYKHFKQRSTIIPLDF